MKLRHLLCVFCLALALPCLATASDGTVEGAASEEAGSIQTAEEPIAPLPTAPSASAAEEGIEALQPPLFAAGTCNAHATCGSQPDVSCSGTSSCHPESRNCASLESGYVKCDGVTTHCSHDPACTQGCITDYIDCLDSCTVRLPCMADCAAQRDYCKCNC